MRKRDSGKPFAWTNDSELDKLTALNQRINAGASTASLRAEFEALTQTVSEKENVLLKAQSDLLTTAEKVMGGTYVQSLVGAERQRREAKYIPNGLKNAGG